MTRLSIPALVTALFGCSVSAQPAAHRDPATTDGDKYEVVLEDDRVRVLRYHDHPGDRTSPHHHPDFVLYALTPFERRLTFPDGTHKDRTFQAGDVVSMPAQTHVGENIGKTDTDVLIVEIKRR